MDEEIDDWGAWEDDRWQQEDLFCQRRGDYQDNNTTTTTFQTEGLAPSASGQWEQQETTTLDFDQSVEGSVGDNSPDAFHVEGLEPPLLSSRQNSRRQSIQ